MIDAQWILIRHIKAESSLQDFKGINMHGSIHYEVGEIIENYKVNIITIKEHAIDILLSPDGTNDKNIIETYPKANIKYTWTPAGNSAPRPW